MIKTSKQLIRENRVKEISPTIFEVLGHSVKIQKRKGKSLLLCDCYNSSLFGHNQFCLHKCAVIIYLANNKFLERIEKLIKEYEKYKELKLPMNADLFINDLNDIKNKF